MVCVSNPPPPRRSSSLSRRVCRSGAEDGVAERCVEDCGPLQLPSNTTDPTQNVLQWILESKRQSRHKSHRWAGALDSAQTVLVCASLLCGHDAGGLMTALNVSLQQPERQESFRRVFGPDSHVGRRWKLWPPTQPPASPAFRPRPRHASSTSSEHLGPAGGGVPPAGGGLHQDNQAEVCRS